MSVETFRSRVLGSLLAGAVGDALGAPVEFWTREQIVAAVGPAGVRSYREASFGNVAGAGLITDDTQMTLFTMEGLMAAYRRGLDRGIGFVMPMVHEAYLRWYRTQVQIYDAATAPTGLGSQEWLYSRRAPGLTCLSALETTLANEQNGSNSLGQPARNDSKGCGGVMRASPFGWIPCDEDDLTTWIVPAALEVAGYTHGHPTGQVSAAALAVLIRELVRGADMEAALKFCITVISTLPGAEETVSSIIEAIKAARARPGDVGKLESLGGGWTGEEALAIAIYSALSYPEPQAFVDALALAVSHSGDSDSTGAICGNILGAKHGLDAIPSHFLDGLEGREAITLLGEQFVDLFTNQYLITTSTYKGEIHD